MEVGKSQRTAVHAAAFEHHAIMRALRDESPIDFAYHMNRHLDAGLVFLSDAAPTGCKPATGGLHSA